MSVIAVIKVPKVKERKVHAPPTRIMRDRRNRRLKDARRKREVFDHESS